MQSLKLWPLAKILVTGPGFWLWLLWALPLTAACNRSTLPAVPKPPPLAKELTFYNWEGDMPQSVLEAFSQEYGIKVNYLVYESQEEAIENIRAGKVYDVLTMESRFIPLLVQDGLLAQINYSHVPNIKNISANFRDLVYDPNNSHSIPYNWGTTGLLIRSDLVAEPVTRWADLWDKRYAGKVGIWAGQPREMIALTLKSLGYSANSEQPAQLEDTLARLIELKSNSFFIEDFDPSSAASVMASGQAVVAVGYAGDMLQGREQNQAITYVLPQEGALLWGDTFIIPANSPNQYTAEVFLNFLLDPRINAQIANENLYATPNEAARPFIKPEILNDPAVFPSDAELKNAELILPLSPSGQKLYNEIWEQFMAVGNNPQ